ncbi:MAG: hypothetical protein GXY44_14550 [Phycisphaerales bacterium]|nr:hypothetical protein [Phycisphaerales bacterium]
MSTLFNAEEICPRANTAGSSRATVGMLTILLAGVFIISLSRYLFYPISFDMAVFQYITNRVAAGQRMYVDIWEQNWPGIIAVHWLANRLVGSSPEALRIFDAGWQFLTLAALLALGWRDEGRRAVGLVAAILYAMAYFGSGFIHAGQRDGMAVLPLLLAFHAVLGKELTGSRIWHVVAAPLLGGMFGFAAFAIKPTLGLCFGVLWLHTFIDSCSLHTFRIPRVIRSLCFAAGFILALAGAVALLIHLDWWSGFRNVMTRRDIPGYVLGPTILRQVINPLLAGGVIVGILCLTLTFRVVKSSRQTVSYAAIQWLGYCILVGGIFGLLLICEQWRTWQQIAIRSMGLLIPAIGAIVSQPWRGRSRVWRMAMLMACSSFAGMVMQGHFFFYHFFPLFAFSAYLAANEIVEGVRGFANNDHGPRAWVLVCLACVTYHTVDYWGLKMAATTTTPHVLTRMSLEEYQDNITKHQPRYPLISTTRKAAERVRALTAETDVIGCLLNEPRLYYLAQRPPVYKLIVPQEVYEHMFDDFMEAIDRERPKVLAARIPASALGADQNAIESAVFDEAEAYFGTGACVIRQHYRVSDIIDDVCLLQPRNN